MSNGQHEVTGTKKSGSSTYMRELCGFFPGVGDQMGMGQREDKEDVRGMEVWVKGR